MITQNNLHPIASFIDEVLPFTPIPREEKSPESIPHSTIAEETPDVESLPELDDEGFAMVKNV